MLSLASVRNQCAILSFQSGTFCRCFPYDAVKEMSVQGTRQGSFPFGHFRHETTFSLPLVAVLGGSLLWNTTSIKQYMTNVLLGWLLQRSFLPNMKEMGSGEQSQSSSFRHVENEVNIFWQVTDLQRHMDCTALSNGSALEHLHAYHLPLLRSNSRGWRRERIFPHILHLSYPCPTGKHCDMTVSLSSEDI